MTNTLVEKDNLSYNINKRLKEKELTSLTTCSEGDKCYLFTYSDSTSDKLIYSIENKTITFNNYTFDIIDGITVEEPTITEHYDTMSSTTYNGYFIINIPIKLDDKDYSIKINKHFNTDSLVIDFRESVFDKSGNRYILVEYLESTGTQYIDTGVLYNRANVYDISTSLRFNNFSQAYFGWNAGGIIGTNGNRLDDGTAAVNYTINTEDFYNIKIEISADTKTYVDNSLVNIRDNSRLSSFAQQSGYPIFTTASNGEYKFWIKVKLKYLSITVDNTLVRDYIPVIDSSNRPCLFDKVVRECYYNQGTGEFLYG